MGPVIFTPRTEASLALLRNALPMLIRRLGNVALPLPREFCNVAVANPGAALELLRRELGEAFVRLWGWLPEFFREVMVDYPHAKFYCYYGIEELRRSVDTAVDIARLVLRLRLGAKVDLNDWLRLFNQASARVIDVPRDYVAVIDDYVTLQILRRRWGSLDIVALGPPIPTPIDLLELIAMGVLDRERLAEVVQFVVKYVGDYVVLSRDLTEAFSRLVNDKDYLSLIRSLGL